MKTAKAVQVFEALSAESRLDVFRLLVKNEPDGLVAGDIAFLIVILGMAISAGYLFQYVL